MAEVRSGSFRTTGYDDSLSPDHYVFSWSLVSQSIVDNTTTIRWSVVAAGGSTSGYYNSVKEKYVTVYSETKSNSEWQTTYNGTTPFSGTTIIKHDANGKGSFNASCGGAFEYSGSYNSTGSGSWDLPTIQRATKPVYSATTANLGGRITITLTPANSTFKHKIRYFWGDLKNQVLGLNIGADFTVQGNSTVTFDIPTSLGEKIPTAFSGVCQVSCYTYTSTGTHIGTESTNITLNVPTYTPSITNVTLTGNNLLSAAYVQGKSSVTVNANVATQYGAKIKSITTVIDGKSYAELPFTTTVLSAGSKTAKITFVDSRDKSVTVESSAFQVYAYSTPNITQFTLERQSDGTTVIATVKGSIAAVNNKNAKTIKVTLNGVTNTITSNTYTINATTTFTGVSTDQTFTAKTVFTDSYISVERVATLPTVAVTMDFYKDGNGIAMGKVAEQGNLLDIAWPIKASGFKSQRGTRPTTADIAPEEKYFGTMEHYLASSAMKTGKPSLVDGYETSPDGYILHFHWDNNLGYDAQMYLRNKNGSLLTRGCNNGTWGAWKQFIDNSMCVDYVIEQGTTDGWNYTKWKNGKIELYADKSLTFPAGTTVATNLNRSIATIDLSGILTTIISGNCPVQYNGMIPQICRHTTYITRAEVVIVTSRTIDGFTITLPLYIIGKWK